MSRYIDADKLKKDFCTHCRETLCEGYCDEVSDEEYDDYYTKQTMIEVRQNDEICEL